jgi:periplasmic divalent cation tolerance protein
LPVRHTLAHLQQGGYVSGPEMAQQALVVITTLGTEAEARAFVTALVEQRVIACGTLLPGRSIYRWEGKVTEAVEVVALLKTDAARWDALRSSVERLHPYEVPELLALPVTQGLERYMSWLANEVTG